jgi:hypothetical protein
LAKGFVLVGPGGDGLMFFGQHLKLAEGRTGPVYRAQQNGNDTSLACLMPFNGSLNFEVVAGVVGKGVGTDE